MKEHEYKSIYIYIYNICVYVYVFHYRKTGRDWAPRFQDKEVYRFFGGKKYSGPKDLEEISGVRLPWSTGLQRAPVMLVGDFTPSKGD